MPSSTATAAAAPSAKAGSKTARTKSPKGASDSKAARAKSPKPNAKAAPTKAKAAKAKEKAAPSAAAAGGWHLSKLATLLKEQAVPSAAAAGGWHSSELAALLKEHDPTDYEVLSVIFAANLIGTLDDLRLIKPEQFELMGCKIGMINRLVALVAKLTPAPPASDMH